MRMSLSFAPAFQTDAARGRIFRALAVFFAACAGVFVFSLAAGADAVDYSLSVLPFPDLGVRVAWWYDFPEDRYYLFLPSGAARGALRIETDRAELKIDGKTVRNGETTSAFAADGDHTVSAGDEATPLTVVSSDGLPALFVETGPGGMEAVHADKSHKEPARITAVNGGSAVFEDRPLDYIKGRGNSTWNNAGKRPYNIKFKEKTSWFGFSASKKWCLLANAFDGTLLRNTAALSLARTLGVYGALGAIHTDLYLNGVYAGNYLLTESVQIGENHIPIRDLGKENEAAVPGADLSALASGRSAGADLPGSMKWIGLPASPQDISGGYLMELEFPDRYKTEPCGFVSGKNQFVVIKNPEYASEAEVRYIASLYAEMEEAVFSENGTNSAGRHYSSYLDQDSFAALYLVLELMMNFDGCSSSFYLSKDAGSALFRAGPAWDYDLSLGSYRVSVFDLALTPDLWIVRDDPLIAQNSESEENLLVRLCEQPEFMGAVTALWNRRVARIKGQWLAGLGALAEENAASAVMDGIRWGGSRNGPAEERRASYLSRVSALIGVIETRIGTLEKGFRQPDSVQSVAGIDLNDRAAEAASTAPAATDVFVETMAGNADAGNAPRRVHPAAYIIPLAAAVCLVLAAVMKKRSGSGPGSAGGGKEEQNV